MLHLLAALPRRNEWVFSSPSSASGCLTEPNNPHTRACIAAGLEGLTLHGLRRSFASLTEWLEVPAGVVAQIQGHKPSATAEKHYKVRPLELLRVHHERIEAWILEQAGIVFDAKAAPGALRVVAA
jgi:integrase